MVSIEVEADDWLAKTIQCELEGTKLFEVNWMEGKIMRAGQREMRVKHWSREYEVSARMNLLLPKMEV
jgi:hypothetical protein